MNTTCKQCGADSGGKKYCCYRCAWTWHNHNRKLKPNAVYKCKVCGKQVSKWVAPSRQASGVDTLEYCSRTCAGRGRAGDRHFNWNGGRSRDKDGYWLVYMPDHPHANNKGQVREHRIVMERHIGRTLKRSEVVHHVNDNPSDNRIENLRLYKNNAAHKSDDAKARNRDRKGRLKPKK